MKPKKILIIDDDPVVARTMQRMVQKGGYLAYAATDAKEGLAKAKEWMPAAILLDMEMPDSNGASVLRALRESEATSAIPVILITGLSKSDVGERIGMEAIADCLSKPIDVRTLLSALERALALPPNAGTS